MILEVSFIEIWKTDKDISRNHKPVLLINIDKKIPNKILANLIQQHIKKNNTSRTNRSLP